MIDKLIRRFIVRYLKKHNVKFNYKNYVICMLSSEYYARLMFYADHIETINCRCSFQPIIITEEDGE